MKSKSLQAVKANESGGHSAAPFFQKKGDKETEAAFFQLPGRPSLRVGKADSLYEKEADDMAESVTSGQADGQSNIQTAPTLYHQATPLAQRQPIEEEEEMLQARLQRQPVEEEEEMLQACLQRQPIEEEEEMLQARLQRQAVEEEEEMLQARLQRQPEEEEMLQARLSSSRSAQPQTNIAARLQSALGQGVPLEDPVRSRMERGFGADFSGVRIHTGSRAEELSQAINAQAFTTGRDIFFNRNKFQPKTVEGAFLLAHELAHTIHQGAVSALSGQSADSESGSATEAKDTAPANAKVAAEQEETPPTETAEAPEDQAVADVEEAEEYPRNPEDHPAFQQSQQQLDQTAERQQSHEPAQSASSRAQAAAPSPANERLSQAQAGQVEVMNEGAENRGTFDAESFKNLLLEQIARIMPTNEEEADEFADSNEMDSVRNAASNQAAAERDNAAGSIQAANEQEPNVDAVPEREITPLEPPDLGPAPGGINAGAAMPPVRPESQVSTPLQENMQGVDDVFAEEEVTDEQLARSNEPDFLAARDATAEAREHTNTAPQNFRGEENNVLSSAQESAENSSANSLQGMRGDRTDLLNQTQEEQQNAMQEDSAERARVANELNAIFESTRTEVEGILESLDAEVERDFDAAEARARRAFENYVERKMDDYKDERYGGITGFARRVGDVFTGLPDEVNEFFTEGRDLYIEIMDEELTLIAENVANKLNEAQVRIVQGRREVADYVAALPEDLQEVGQEAANEIQAQFDELESSVENKQNQLVNDLARRYQEGLEAVDARIEEMQAANRGLIDMALDFARKVVEVIREIKNVITNLISSVVAAVRAIIADPIGFLGNLIDGISQGIDNFFSNIWDHLVAGFFQWLTGALGPVGITIPENLFSLEGAFDLIRQVLGLTWDFIREQAVKVFGEDVVRVIETTFEILVLFARGGLMAVWEYIKDRLNDLKEKVLDAIMNMVITEVIEAGIKWLLGLLNPASAFVKAALAIIDIVKFFIQRGRQIIQLVQAFTQAIMEIASGNVSRVASAIEDALARAIPVVIGFLAALLGIGDLVGKVQNLIQTVRTRIANAIISVFQGIKNLALRLFSRLSGRREDDEEPEEGTENQGDEALEDSEVGEVISFTVEGESHRLWINTAGSGVEVMIASAPMSVGDKLDDWQNRLDEVGEENRGEASSLIGQARAQYQATLQSGNVAEQEMEQAINSDDTSEIQQAEDADERVEADEQTLKGTLKRLFELFGEEGAIEEILALSQAFTEEDGDNHTLKFESENGELRLMVLSDPKNIFEYLQSDDIDQNDSIVNDAIRLATEIRTMAGQINAEGIPNLNAKLRELSEMMAHIRGWYWKHLPANPVYTFSPENGKARTATADLLSPNRSGGTEPGGAQVKGWEAIKQGLTTGGGFWKRLHLINQKFGGFGVAENLTPGTASDNSTFESRFDRPVKDKIGENPNDSSFDGVVKIVITVDYSSGDFPANKKAPKGAPAVNPAFDELDSSQRVSQSNYAESINFEAWEYERQNDAWVLDNSTFVSSDMSIDLPDWDAVNPAQVGVAAPSELKSAFDQRTTQQADVHITTSFEELLSPTVLDIIRMRTYGGASDFQSHLDANHQTPAGNDRTFDTIRRLNTLKQVIPILVNVESVLKW